MSIGQSNGDLLSMNTITNAELAYLAGSERDPKFITYARGEVNRTLETFMAHGGKSPHRDKPTAAAATTPIVDHVELPLYPVSVCDSIGEATADIPVLRMRREVWQELKDYGLHICIEEPNKVLIYNVAGPAASLLAKHKRVFLVRTPDDHVFLGDEDGAEICEFVA
jgi:hypothetical protein